MRHHRATVGAADCLGETAICTCRVSFAPENIHTFRRDVWLTLSWIRDHHPPRDLAAPTARGDPGTVAPRTEYPLRHWWKTVQTRRVVDHHAYYFFFLIRYYAAAGLLQCCGVGHQSCAIAAVHARPLLGSQVTVCVIIAAS